MSYLLAGVGFLGYLLYDRDKLAYQSLKIYTYLESKYSELSNNKLKIIKELEILDQSDTFLTKLFYFSYNNKEYREFSDTEPFYTKEDSLNILENYKSPILAISVNLYNGTDLLVSELDVTDYLNTFIVPNNTLQFGNEYSFIWTYLLNDIVNQNLEDLTIEWCLVDNEANYYKYKNFKLVTNLNHFQIIDESN